MFYLIIRFRSTIENLNTNLGKLKKQTENLSDTSLNKLFALNNLNDSQKTLIQEIINTSKVPNPKNKRYSENWILLCVILKIRYLCLNKFYSSIFHILYFIFIGNFNF